MMQETTRRQRQPEARLLQVVFEMQERCGFAAGDVNLHRYVGNNPTNMTDPSGLAGEWLHEDYGEWKFKVRGQEVKTPGKHVTLDTWTSKDGKEWEFRLQPVKALKEPTMKDMMLLRELFPPPKGPGKDGWTFTLAGNFTLSAKSLRVKGYSGQVTSKESGFSTVHICVQYLPGAKDPTGKSIHWIQFIDMDPRTAKEYNGNPNKTHILDNARKTDTPYFDLASAASPEGFNDDPTLIDPPIQETFRVFVVEQTAPKTVRILQGLSWGFTYAEKKK
jgi:hypothetical protein